MPGIIVGDVDLLRVCLDDREAIFLSKYFWLIAFIVYYYTSFRKNEVQNMSERTLVTSNKTLSELNLIMLRTIVLKYCQLYHPFTNTSIPKKSPPFPSFYDVNVSLLSK